MIGLVIDNGLVTALVPVGFVMIVSLMVWIIRELGRLSDSLTDLAAAVREHKTDIDGLQVITTGQTAAIATTDSKVAYIEGRMRGNGGFAPAK